MAKQPTYTFPISAVFLTIAGIALLFSNGLSFWFLLLVTELFAIYVCVELLTQQMPATLRAQSQANCYRLDGTRSHRREFRELRSLRKVRSDLWAVFLTVAFIGTGGLFLIHTQVFPISLVPDVVSAAVDNPADIKGGLRQRNVDRKFFSSARSSSRSSKDEINQQMRQLWMIWPVVLGLAVAGLVACLSLIRYTYLRTLSEFHLKVSTRATEYLNLDTGRLQE